MECFPHIENLKLGEDGGLRIALSSGIEGRHPMVAPDQTNEHDNGLIIAFQVSNTADFTLSLDFSGQRQKPPFQHGSNTHLENHQATPEIGFIGSEGYPNQALRLDDVAPNADFWDRLDKDANFPAASHSPFDTISPNTAFRLNDHDIPDYVAKFTQDMPFSFASSSSSSTTDTSPNTAATSPSPMNTSPDVHSCPLRRSTFKRLSDLKRHEGVHFREWRKYHCTQAGCERNRRKGFYRKDKLKAHEKQVYGLDV